MTSYRIAGLRKIYTSEKIELSHKKNREIEKKLEKSRYQYEQNIRKSFIHSYFHSYRITIFGSAKIHDISAENFRFVSNLTKRLGKVMDIDIVTGGGGGLMLAANHGLAEAVIEAKKNNRKHNGKNLGIMVDLPGGEGGEKFLQGNGYLDYSKKFENFSTRLEEFVRDSNGVYLAPGGFGTDLEAAMFIQLKQKGKLEYNFPILAHPFWKPIFNYEKHLMYGKRIKKGKTAYITENDLNLIYYTDNISEIVRIFKKSYSSWKNLKKKKVVYSE